jgi:2-oxoglutarate dehydrogenase E1 component
MHNVDPQILDGFRRWGYLQADLDWLGRLEPAAHNDLDWDHPDVERIRKWYCGTLAVEFMHIPDPDRRGWIQSQMESEPELEDSWRILRGLMRASLLEEILQNRYIGTKRFSVEGHEALIPFLEEIFEQAAERDAQSIVLAMSHRGRLNVMVNSMGVHPRDLFAGFEDVDPRSIMGAGDVKYHLGATGVFESRSGHKVDLHLVSNPSHLEAVAPVAIGRAKAKQVRAGDTRGHQVLPVILHGDAAMAGQGITAETFNLASLDGFSVGGSLHVVVNNLIGFTAGPAALYSSRFSSDIAKRMPIPIFHANAEDPDSVVRAARLAVGYRNAFGSDVVVDLIGFRRHGHSEIDDPTLTQPHLYARIKRRPPLWRRFAESRGVETVETEMAAAQIREDLVAAQESADGVEEIPRLATARSFWSAFDGGPYSREMEVDTGVPIGELQTLTTQLTTVPETFHLHPKLARLLEQRGAMGRGERPLDFGMAETLALASLLVEGTPVRFTGQDSRRGTFNQRHSVFIDQETEEEYSLLRDLGEGQARFDIYDSMLSEAAVLGYEYGYSRDYPETLVLWEAQFGDFANGAQIILDQFITAGEDKWGLLSGLVILLPHGYEGQGPEHSSARMERYLQLAAEDAIQVVQPSTAGQYFHLLRRQALRSWRKPLIVFTPKSMLRSPAAASPVEDLSRSRFQPVLGEDLSGEEVTRLLICTGKIAHELRAERRQREKSSVAVLTLEQLYPFPDQELAVELERYGEIRDIVWVQEEPANMGALDYAVRRIERVVGGHRVRTVKRSASASPATGSAKAHQMEQATLLSLALA